MGQGKLYGFKIALLNEERYKPARVDVKTVEDGRRLLEGDNITSLVDIIDEVIQASHTTGDYHLISKRMSLVYEECYHDDSRGVLEALGFKVKDIGEDKFYGCELPEGWNITTSGYHTTIRDSRGRIRLKQFYKALDDRLRCDLTSPNLNIMIRANPLDNEFLEAYSKFQAALKEEFCIDEMSFVDAVDISISKQFGRNRINRLEKGLLTHFYLDPHNIHMGASTNRFVNNFFYHIRELYENGTISNDTLIPIIVGNISGKGGYEKSFSGPEDILEDMGEFVSFLDECFLTVLEGEPSDLTMKHRTIELLIEERKKSKNISIPHKVCYDPNIGYEKCRHPDGTLTKAGARFQRDQEKLINHYNQLLLKADNFLADMSIPYSERIKSAYDSIVEFLDKRPLFFDDEIEHLEFLGRDFRDLTYDFSVSNNQIMPSGLRINLSVYYVGTSRLFNGKGIIDYDGSEQEMTINISCKGVGDIEQQLNEFDKAENIIDRTLGRYIVDVK